MTKLNPLKNACSVFLLLAATAIASPAQTFKTLVNFDGSNGSTPFSMSLIQGVDGSLHGTTFYGGTNIFDGTAFKITARGTLKTLHSFCAQNNCIDGEEPYAGLVLATDENFYGTTQYGGTNGIGTMFRLTPAGATTGYVTVTTPSGTLTSNVPFHVIR